MSEQKQTELPPPYSPGFEPYPPPGGPPVPAGGAPIPSQPPIVPVAQQEQMTYSDITGNQPQTYIVTTANQPVPVQQQPTTVVVAQAGLGCRYCGGPIVARFTCCGIVCAILFFPIGLLCCFVMRKPVCASCGRDA